jgi:hypothetical protein
MCAGSVEAQSTLSTPISFARIPPHRSLCIPRTYQQIMSGTSFAFVTEAGKTDSKTPEVSLQAVPQEPKRKTFPQTNVPESGEIINETQFCFIDPRPFQAAPNLALLANESVNQHFQSPAENFCCR